MRRPNGTVTAGPKWGGGGAAGGRGQQVGGRRRRNVFTVVGGVCPYVGAYQGGTGCQMGDRENIKVQHVHHPEWTEQGSVIGTSWSGAGTG